MGKRHKKKRKSVKVESSDVIIKHDMRPPAGILNVFSRLTYKPHYAIAEFVDNSTQSYFQHSEKLRNTFPDYQMHVRINYDDINKTLVVADNAFGMEKERFLDAITLDAKNSDQENSRNEFGMGLKTAASWFGNVWTVSSTALGSRNRYVAAVDIPELQRTGMNNIDIRVEAAEPDEHGTTIEIRDVTKGLSSRSIGKIRSSLASMYRRDLKENTVNLYFNNQEILFSGFEVLEFRDHQWKKPLDFFVEFAGKRFHVTGFVGIMNPGSHPKAGFALFRRNRVIIGGEDQNYKPREIFVQAQSQISLKLFGELDMDDFPVNQAKDGFIWDDGLQDEFISELQKNIREFIDVARMSTKERVREELFSQEASSRVEDEVQKAVDRANHEADSPQAPAGEPEVDSGDSTSLRFDGSETYAEVCAVYKKDLKDQNSQPEVCMESPRVYNVRLNKITSIKISVTWKISDNKKWLEVTEREKGDIGVVINVNHPFFKPHSTDEGFQVVLEKFVIAFVVAEEQAKLNSTREGYILHFSIRGYMNQYLQKLSGE